MKVFNLLFAALILIVITSCNQEPIGGLHEKPLDQYERTKQIVAEKIKEVKSANSTALRSQGVNDDPCEIDLTGCSQWTHPLAIYVDLTNS